MSVGLLEAHGVQRPVKLPRDEVIHLDLAKGISGKRAEPSNTELKKRHTKSKRRPSCS